MKHIKKDSLLSSEVFREPNIPVLEEKILQTIRSSMQKLEMSQFEQPLDIWEFLYLQSRFIKKYWWIIQAVLLSVLYWYVRHLGEAQMVRQVLGIGAPLFVILVIPELWKNSNNNALDIEATTMYTLQQVYAARLVLFAGVDLLLLSLFCLGITASKCLSLWEFVTQFLMPMNVTCCICLTCLYCPRVGNQSFSLVLCLLFAMVWREVVQTEQFYEAITVPAWATMLILSFVYIGYCVFRGQRNWKEIVAVQLAGNEVF